MKNKTQTINFRLPSTEKSLIIKEAHRQNKTISRFMLDRWQDFKQYGDLLFKLKSNNLNNARMEIKIINKGDNV